MKMLSSFMVISFNGGDRVSYTYDVVDEDTGDIVDANSKESFVVTSDEVAGAIETVRNYIREHKLS